MVVNPQSATISAINIYQSRKKLPLSNLENFLSYFSSNIPYFEAKFEDGIPVNHRVYVEGILMHRNSNEFEIYSSKIYASLEDLLLPYKKHIKLGFIFLCITSFLLIIALSYKHNKEKNHSNSLEDGPVCASCPNSANIILKPCYHLSVCKKCLISHRYCPRCQAFIQGHIIVLQEA